MRLSGTKATAIHQYRGLGNQLWDLAGNRPSLDLRFAESKSLVDATTGTNLIDFTRASSGTYVGSDGLIKTATTNLLLQSEDLTVSPWTPVGAVITEDYTQGVPFEGAKVYKIVFSATNQNVSQLVTYLAEEYTASIYAKGTQGDVIRFSGKSGQSAGNYTLDGSWERLTQPFTATAGTANFNLNTGGLPAVTVYVAAPQLEQSSTVGEYVPTTSTINSAPRFDHDPTTGESLGLLVEESRTNLLLYSENFNQWVKTNTTVTIDSSVELAPDGTATADKIVEIAVTDYHFVDNPTPNPTVTNGSVFTASFYAKAAERTTFHVYLISSGIVANSATQFDLSTGTVVSGSQAAIKNVGNGWYRCSIYGTANSTVARVRILLNGNFSYTGDGTSGIYIWGAQLEEGSFPTSYIPTEGSTVTRAADVASITGSNFSSWYRQDEGTVFAEFLMRADATAGVAYLNNGNVGEATRIFYNSAISNYTFSVRAAGSEQSSINNLGAYVLQFERISAAYKVNDLAASRNGGASISDTSATLPTGIDRLELGTNQAANYLNGTISRLTYWPTRLPNETLQGITQQ